MRDTRKHFALTLAASVLSSLITIVILGAVDRARALAARPPSILPQPLPPGQGQA